MKNLNNFIKESLNINESKEEYKINLCSEEGDVIEETTIELDTHGKNKEDYYFDMSSQERKKLEKMVDDILKKAHQKNREITLGCIEYDEDGGSETLAEI